MPKAKTKASKKVKKEFKKAKGLKLKPSKMKKSKIKG